MSLSRFVVAGVFAVSLLLGPVGNAVAAFWPPTSACGMEMGAQNDSCCCSGNESKTSCSDHCLKEFSQDHSKQGLLPPKRKALAASLCAVFHQAAISPSPARTWRFQRDPQSKAQAPPGALYIVHQSLLL